MNDFRPFCPAGQLVVDWLEQDGRPRDRKDPPKLEGQRALADALGVAHSVLYRWLVGDHTPKLEFALRIENVTGVPVRAWVENERP